MTIRANRGVLKVPIKLFYIIVLAICVFILLCIHLLRLEDTVGVTVCAEEQADDLHSGRRHRSNDKHVGCTKDPIYINTWSSCPECFRPTIQELSENFTEIQPERNTFPRGPSGFFKPRGTKQQNFVDKVIISPSSVCVDTCPFLLALQLSVSGRFEERNTIRSTWGSVAKTKVWPHACINADFQIVFVLAHQSTLSEFNANRNIPSETVSSTHDMENIRTEANRYGDILYLDMIDSYFNLTLKLMSTLHWVRSHCPRTKFFLKVDADTFVNIPLLLDLLIYNEKFLQYSLTGHIYTGEKHVFRTGRWGVSKELYPLHMFPTYASGCAYVISNKALSRVVELFPYFPILELEDVFITGILGRAAKLGYFSDNLYALFTHYHSDKWSWCSLLNDTLVTGTGVNRKFKKNIIWSGYLLDDLVCKTRNLINMHCYCEDEFESQQTWNTK